MNDSSAQNPWTRVAQCPRIEGNPNNNPHLPQRKAVRTISPVYASSEPEIWSGGSRYLRTGVCTECDGAIYAVCNAHGIDPEYPLFHAAPPAGYR